ncbi:MAG: hypothetical protein E3K32_08735 [wastewater metagenome]|nr:hypothetical protein [Candidatus Loosdrechtia aerotolerans]
MQTKHQGFWSWFLQRITALLLVIGMSIHFFLFHFSPNRYTSRYYNEIVYQYCTPGWITFHLCLLSLVIYHGLNGFWGIFLDFNPGKRAHFIFKYLLWSIGLILFGIGTYILIWFAMNNGE